MAARKSCTHLTWAEAKAKVGSDPPNEKSKKISSKKNLTEKFIAKHAATENDLSKAAVRRKERADAKASAAIAAARERERAARNAPVKTVDLAAKRLKSMALELRETRTASYPSTTPDATQEQIAECKEQQLDEILALQAIWADEILMDKSCCYEELCEKRDKGENLTEVRNLAFSYQLTVEDLCIEGVDATAHVLLHVELPSLYPMSDIPLIEIVDVMVSDSQATQHVNKVLESIAHEVIVDKEVVQRTAQELLPDPSLVAIITWLQENVMEGASLRTLAK